MNKKTPCKPIENKIIEEKIQEKLKELSEKGDISINNKNLNLNLINNKTNIDNMPKTGMKRDTKDQFYTKRDVSTKCIELFMNEVKPCKNDIIIEPSAGDGAFSDYFKENQCNIDAYDIEPKKEYIIKQDFLELNIEKYTNNCNKIHCCGNPPFGRQSSIAKSFIKKLALFCNTIAFILPKSFKKDTFKKVFPPNYHLEIEFDIGAHAFTIDGKSHNVPCVFQIWIKKDYDRFIKPIEDPYGFIWIKKPQVEQIGLNDKGKPIKKHIFEEEPDFGVLRAGGGSGCGKLSEKYLDGVVCYEQAWLFIKLDEKYDKEIFKGKYNSIDFSSDDNIGMRSISKPIFVEAINKILRTMD